MIFFTGNDRNISGCGVFVYYLPLPRFGCHLGNDSLTLADAIHFRSFAT